MEEIQQEVAVKEKVPSRKGEGEEIGDGDLSEQIKQISLAQQHVQEDSLPVGRDDDKSREDEGGSGTSSENEESGNNSDNNEDGPVVAPVLDLPPLELISNKVEDENQILEYRAKLYRFDPEAKQWIDRGIGCIKLLQSKHDPTQCRTVMWRENTGTVACNFRLFPEINITNYQSNGKILCWKCQDLSDTDEPEWETFTCRFASEANCLDFKEQILKYAKEPPIPPIVNAKIAEDDEEVSTCPGCDGCQPDSFNFLSIPISPQKESLIDCELGTDSCAGVPRKVSLKQSIASD